jgi:hypothetical protein
MLSEMCGWCAQSFRPLREFSLFGSADFCSYKCLSAYTAEYFRNAHLAHKGT